jgi:uncharacterized coiled-coil protein SlyX
MADLTKDKNASSRCERFDEIENSLDKYIREDHEHPDMKVFASSYGFEYADVAEVIRDSVLLELTGPQKELLIRSFVKREAEVPTPQVVESSREWSRRRRKEILKEFKDSQETVQEFLVSHSDIPETQLRNIIPQDLWQQRYVYKERNDWRELLRIFLEDVPTISVQQFCSEQGLDINKFQKICPKEVWQKRYDYKRRTVNWQAEIEGMMKSDLCLQDWAFQHDLSVTIFRKKCGEEITRKYDRDGRRASAFDPNLSLKENADKLGMSTSWLSWWVNSKLKELDPAKFKAFKMDEKDERIVELEAKIRTLEDEVQEQKQTIQRLENHLANKNSYITQMQTTQAQKAAKVAAAKKTLEDLIKGL